MTIRFLLKPITLCYIINNVDGLADATYQKRKQLAS